MRNKKKMIINNVNIDFGAMNIGMKDPKPPNGGWVWVWGYQQLSELGNNLFTRVSSPIQTTAGGYTWIACCAGKNHSGGIKSDGTLWTWGYNSTGQLGDNTQIQRNSAVQTIAGGTNWKQVSMGYGVSGAIKTDGTLWMWGSGFSGTIGDNTNGVASYKSSPVQTVAGGTNWSQISVADSFCAAIKTDGTLWTWGVGQYGSIGDNTVIAKSSPVQTVAGGTNWKQVAASHNVTAVKNDGTLWVWGRNNYGQIGDNTQIQRNSPVQIFGGGTNWDKVAIQSPQFYDSFSNGSAAIKTDGTLWLWGRNIYSNIGDNTNIAKSSPVQTVAGGTNWANVAMGGGGSTAATKTDGTFWMWGANSTGNNEGKLGDGTLLGRSSPIQTVSAGTDWKSFGCGQNHTIAIREIIYPG